MQGVKLDVSKMIHYAIIRIRQVGTPLLDSPVFSGLIGTVARGFTWNQHGDARLASSLLLQSTVPLFGPAQLTQVWSMYS